MEGSLMIWKKTRQTWGEDGGKTVRSSRPAAQVLFDPLARSIHDPLASAVSMSPAAPRKLSAGVVVVRREAGDWRFLLLRAFKNWDFPKGLVEPGEEPLAAARREVLEETLIEDLRFDWGLEYRETEPYGHNKVARYYLAATGQCTVTLPVSPELGVPEHHEFRWAGLEEAQALCPSRLAPILGWAAQTLEIAAP
jgi:8-oxo-dGTP pyrophosphatase MutT (NUDIX family)